MTELPSPASGQGKIIVYGSFKGMGDLLNASPVIAHELNAGNLVKLLLFPSQALTDFVNLLDFGPNRTNLQTYTLPVSRRLKDFKTFFGQMSQFQPTLIWISPHAPRPASSWKLPLLLWLIKKLYWPNAKLAGASSEHMSFLFDLRIQVDRDLPLGIREQTAYLSMLAGRNNALRFPLVPFVESIRNNRHEIPKYDLLIHPGANAKNRTWPVANYVNTINLIPSQFSVAIVGLPEDLKQIQKLLPNNRDVRLISGTLEQAIAAIAQARVVLTMDSGNAHFANFLSVPGVALFGKSDPSSIISPKGSVLPIYERKYPCQPCGKATCSQPEVYCMNSIAPETVADALLDLLKTRKI
ncbi:MAG TPA: glycosyltransferase family 9 protein [Acidobacteriaceae bacterium]|nr:glycosyltransferase family 9 protein [Acidobacteriaceae bacterium]